MSTTKAEKQQDQQRAIEHLQRTFDVGDVINTQVVHVSSSGMGRLVQVYAVIDGGRVWDCSIVVARALGRRWQPGLANGATGIHVSGAGFDAGHEIAYHLRQVLFGESSREALEGLRHNRV